MIEFDQVSFGYPHGTQLFDRFWGMSMAELREIDHAEMMRFGMQFRELMLDLPFQLPQNLLMLGRTVAILSGSVTSTRFRLVFP